MTARGHLRVLTDVLAKRESEGETAGFDRLRVEREGFDVETDLAVAGTERTRAQATLAGFLAEISDPSQIVAVGRPAPSVGLPSLAALMERAESVRGELLALRHEIEAAHCAARSAERRRIPEPELVAGTKSSSFGAGDIGSVVTVQAIIPLFDRGRPERALAAARAAQAEARATSFRAVLRGQVGSLRAAVIQRRAVAQRYQTEAVDGAAQIERIAQVSYDAGERGILELLDAYRIGASARVRQASLNAAVRKAEIELEFVSGWEIP